jgi:hypothetical protein
MHTQPRQIAMLPPRLFEDMRLSASAPERIREVGVVGTAYDSVMASDITYVSTPITSGRALYAAMDAAGVATLEELRRDASFFRKNVIDVNIAAADAVARAMVAFGGAVIAPAAFEARSLGWSQDEYMGLWLDVIERRATRLAMVDGWQYSNGGAEEYLQALLMQADRRDRTDISIVDARGDVIPHLTAIRMLADAVVDVADRGFEPLVLAKVLHRCVVLHGMVRSEQGGYGHLSDRCGRTSFAVGSGYRDAESDWVEMREGLIGLRGVLEATGRFLPADELAIASSLDLAPGLVRSSGRAELVESPATVIVSDAGSREDGA